MSYARQRDRVLAYIEKGKAEGEAPYIHIYIVIGVVIVGVIGAIIYCCARSRPLALRHR